MAEVGGNKKKSAKDQHQHHPHHRPKNFPIPLAETVPAAVITEEYSPREEGRGKRPSSNPGRQSGKLMTTTTTTMLSSDDWLADMANNNVSAAEAAALRHKAAQLSSGGGGGRGNRGGRNGDHRVGVSRGQHLNPTLGPVVQLIGVSVKKERRDQVTSGRTVFTGLNLTFTCGRIFVVIGEPQSGKTALLQTLAKIRSPAAGKVKYLSVNEKTSKDLTDKAGGKKTISKGGRLSAGFMAQRGGFFADFSPVENVQYFAKLHCLEPVVAHNKLHRLMTMIGWEQKSVPVGRLTAVQQTLVSLAIASIHSPAVLILDEPNFGADLFLKEHIWRQLKKLTTAEAVTIIFSTRTVEDVRFADEAAIVRKKSLVPCLLTVPAPVSAAPLDGPTTPTSVDGKSLMSDLPAAAESSPSSLDIASLLSVDVDKIRQYVATSYQLQNKLEEEEEEEESESETLKGGKSGKVNKAFEKSPSLDSRTSEVQLEMSWPTTAIDGSNINSSLHTLRNTQLKRLHREAPFITKLLLSFLIIIKLLLRQPLYTLAQLLLPALLVSLLSTFVGQNPFAIPVAVYNPDQPSIVSRHVINSLDGHTIHVQEYPTLEAAVQAVRLHLAWAVMEFPANYTNSMINRALQTCEGDSDFDEEPEAESISGHLVDSEAHHRQFDKLSNSKNDSSGSDRIDSPADLTAEDADLARIFRSVRPVSKRSTLEKEEEHEENNGTVARDGGVGSTLSIGGPSLVTPVNGNGVSRSGSSEAESPEAHALGNDIDVNHKKLKPINLITIRLHIDNTNLLVAGFIKAKIFAALQKAQADPALATLSPKIPTPLELVTPNIYGSEDTPMGEWLLPGTLVLVFTLTSALLPLPLLTRLKRAPVFDSLQLGGISRPLLVAVFTTVQLAIMAVQLAITLLVVGTLLVNAHQRDYLLNSLGLTFVLVAQQGTVALLLSTVALFALNLRRPGLVVALLQLNYFTGLLLFGGILWPLECMPLAVRRSVVHLLPQSVAAEGLRSVFSRGWGWQQYHHLTTENDVLWWAVNLPLAWIAGLQLMTMIAVKLY